ncbi:hypothetical protein G7046_g9937 [Stylonectria norvegica]|nr:hypothetical protein G7046_g9937 [Stylonectria norvegica]
MERVADATPDGTSPRTFALNHLRSRSSFQGCSRISDYELQGKLGEGTFGEVHRARSRKTGALVALKKIIMHHEKDGFPITALREIKLLKLLSHKNILRLEDMAVEHPTRASELPNLLRLSLVSPWLTSLPTADKRKKPIMYMVTPYMDHDLSGLLDNPSVTFQEAQIKCYMLQLLEGLRYLHENHILHRDMKAANLLINNKGILQIADFGLARHYEGMIPKAGRPMGDGRREYTGLVVTRWYRPPELLLQLRQYTTAIDVWGVGCVFGEMLVGKPILAGESDVHQLDIIWDLMGSPSDDNMPEWKSLPGTKHLQPPRPRTGNLQTRFREFGSGAISLLKDLLKLDWRTRINAVDALQHPYFKMQPLPVDPHMIPIYEESHELDRRKFHDRKAALPPAPKGAMPTATVEMERTGDFETGPTTADRHGSGNADHHPRAHRPERSQIIGIEELLETGLHYHGARTEGVPMWIHTSQHMGGMMEYDEEMTVLRERPGPREKIGLLETSVCPEMTGFHREMIVFPGTIGFRETIDAVIIVEKTADPETERGRNATYTDDERLATVEQTDGTGGRDKAFSD